MEDIEVTFGMMAMTACSEDLIRLIIAQVS